MATLYFFLGVSFIFIGFIVLYRFRKRIAWVFYKIPLPVFALFLLSAVPFILLEESINCIDYGDGRGCVVTPWIIGVLVIEMTILGLIVHFMRISSIKWPLIIFSLFGAMWELLVGGLSSLGFGIFLLFMFIYVAVSYAFIAVIPLTILTEDKN